VAIKAHFTIFSGPPRSGKTRYANELKSDPNQKVFIQFEGHNEEHVIRQIFAVLADGCDVIYETTHPVTRISQQLLDRVDTIEVFRVN
jgi:hypothetical protein